LHLSTSSDSEQGTEVWHGTENVVRKSLEIFHSIQNQYDLCIPVKGPDTILSQDRIRNAMHDLKNRGIIIRIITEVTDYNLTSCRELSTIAEVRHLSEIVGSFVIADRIKYGGLADLENVFPYITELIYSNVSSFVKQQQYFFEMLWKKAIPLKQRIKEIKEGSKREFIETIQDSNETTKLMLDLIKSASDEILVVFPSANILLLFKKQSILKSLKDSTQRGIKIRILVEKKSTHDEMWEQILREENFQVRYPGKSLETKIVTFIVDNEFSMALEIRDDKAGSLYEAMGLTAYSNSESTVFSYVSIFETLWMEAELKYKK
jgi:sugar-specific transcriptional regulator TrmB